MTNSVFFKWLTKEDLRSDIPKGSGILYLQEKDFLFLSVSLQSLVPGGPLLLSGKLCVEPWVTITNVRDNELVREQTLILAHSF